MYHLTVECDDKKKNYEFASIALAVGWMVFYLKGDYTDARICKGNGDFVCKGYNFGDLVIVD